MGRGRPQARAAQGVRATARSGAGRLRARHAGTTPGDPEDVEAIRRHAAGRFPLPTPRAARRSPRDTGSSPYGWRDRGGLSVITRMRKTPSTTGAREAPASPVRRRGTAAPRGQPLPPSTAIRLADMPRVAREDAPGETHSTKRLGPRARRKSRSGDPGRSERGFQGSSDVA